MVAGHLQQKKEYWYMVLNFYDEQGKRKPKWIATHLPVQGNKRRAEELLLQTRQQYADNQGRSGLLFADYMLQWLEKMRPRVSPTTYHGYRYNVERGICPYFRAHGIILPNLRVADLEQFYAHLQKQGLSSNTVIHYHANIHKALKDAVRLDLVERNVAELVERPQKQKYLPAHYSAEEVNLLLDKLRGHWMFVPVTLSVFYGLRRSEVLGLQWRSVDFENRAIAIQQTRVLEAVDGKDVAIGRDVLKRKSSYRTLPMPDTVYTMLNDLKVSRYSEDTVAPDDYICLNRKEAHRTQLFNPVLQAVPAGQRPAGDSSARFTTYLRLGSHPEPGAADRSAAVVGAQYLGNNSRPVRPSGIRNQSGQCGIAQKKFNWRNGI